MINLGFLIIVIDNIMGMTAHSYVYDNLIYSPILISSFSLSLGNKR